MSKLILLIMILLTSISYGHGYVGYNYDSQQGFSDKVGGTIVILFLLFTLYVIIRVKKELKKDE